VRSLEDFPRFLKQKKRVRKEKMHGSKIAIPSRRVEQVEGGAIGVEARLGEGVLDEAGGWASGGGSEEVDAEEGEEVGVAIASNLRDR
jgi:hypothetical protein